MSWKLTKSTTCFNHSRQPELTRLAELKETHLAPLANTFSRSSSTTTVVPAEPQQSGTPRASTDKSSNAPQIPAPSSDIKDPTHIGV